MHHKRDSAFTLIELIIVIAVIGILASITMVGYGNYRKHANATQFETDATSIFRKAQAMQSEGTSNAAYPSPTNTFPTSASAHALPSGTGVTFVQSAPSHAVTNAVASVTTDPALNDTVSIAAPALSVNSTTNKKTYAVKSCNSGAGFIIFYPDPTNSSTANSAVKRLTAGNITGC